MLFFFFNDTATTEIYTLSLHDALPISRLLHMQGWEIYILTRHPKRSSLGITYVEWLTDRAAPEKQLEGIDAFVNLDRKSTRLNSSHANISYAVFCLKKNKSQNLILDQS